MGKVAAIKVRAKKGFAYVTSLVIIIATIIAVAILLFFVFDKIGPLW